MSYFLIGLGILIAVWIITDEEKGKIGFFDSIITFFMWPAVLFLLLNEILKNLEKIAKKK